MEKERSKVCHRVLGSDEELITFYLAAKVFSADYINNDVKFAEVDLNRCEPWELPEVAKMGEREWYLMSWKDRKYTRGLRRNRATGTAYWKATGKDREVYSGGHVVGMKKTLVFYKGRAPRGHKTKWLMHEYRLHPHFSTSKAEAQPEWVICRIHQKSWENRNAMEAAKCGFKSQRQMHTNLNLDVFPVQPNCFHFQQHVQLDEDANCSWMENEYHECLGVETDMDTAVLPFSPFHHHIGMGASHPQQSWPPYFI